MYDIDQLKRFDMKSLLEKWYGLTFQRKGNGYVSLSPFTAETNASFVVRCVDGVWLFKDFSSDKGGSLIDFVLLKEGFGDVSEALTHLRSLVTTPEIEQIPDPVAKTGAAHPHSGYDIQSLYSHLRKNDLSVCREYLLERGIAVEVIDNLVDGGILLHNRHKNHSWCCFAVYDHQGNLCCLDNHRIDGVEKFVLGKKEIFTRDWDLLSQAGAVFVCEGIIDYLSMKTLEGMDFPGLALLGNVIRFPASLLSAATIILSAFDYDAGGMSAFLDLNDLYPDKKISVLDMVSCSDPNEFLQSVKAGKEQSSLDATDKLTIYNEYIAASNKSEVAHRWGINRSYMYQVIHDCEKQIMNGLKNRKPGRKKKGAPSDLDEAFERISQLEAEKDHESREKERYYVRSEFLNLRLKWSERELSETRGSNQQSSGKKIKKKQIKKKRKKK